MEQPVRIGSSRRATAATHGRLGHRLADRVLHPAVDMDGPAAHGQIDMTINGSPREKRPGENEDVEVLGGGIGVSTGLFLLALDGRTKSRPLVTDREVGEFVFSPDGARIAFETTAPNTPVRGRRRVTASGAPHPQDAAQADIALVDVRSRTVKLVAATEASETMRKSLCGLRAAMGSMRLRMSALVQDVTPLT